MGALAALADRIAWDALLASARTAEPAWILAALLLMPLNVGLEAYRWFRLVRRLDPGLRYPDALAAVLCGYPVGLLTPARTGDFVGRALYLPHPDKGALVALTLVERLATLACMVAGGLLAIVPFLRAQADLPAAAWAALVTVSSAAAGALVVLLLHPSLAARVVGTVVPLGAVRRALRALHRIDRREATTLLGLSAVRYVIFCGQFVLLVRAFEPTVSLAAVTLGVALVFFAKSAIPSLTLGDLGVREGAAVFFLGALGVGAAAAFEASLLLFGLNLLLPALAGAPLLLRLRLPQEDEAKPLPAPAETSG